MNLTKDRHETERSITFFNPQILYYSTMVFQLAGVSNADVVTVTVGVVTVAAALIAVSHQYFSLLHAESSPLPSPLLPFLRCSLLRWWGGELLCCMEWEAWQFSSHYSLACSVFRCAHLSLPPSLPLSLPPSLLPLSSVVCSFSITFRLVSMATNLAQ